MPYIKQKHRPQFDGLIKALSNSFIDDREEFDNLYYIIGYLIMKTIRPKKYRQMMEVTGLLSNIRQEFERQIGGNIDYGAVYGDFPQSEWDTHYDKEIDELTQELREGCGGIYGNLNYCVSSLLVDLYGDDLYNDEIASVLFHLYDDFYAQVMSPYEDLKIKENGHVY